MASFFVALASTVLPMFFPAALVLGIIALRDVKKTKRDGKVFAVVGVVVGGLQTVIAIGMILWWVFVDQPS